MFLNRIRKSRTAKITALTLALQMVLQWFAPTRAFALTTGPSQPEMQSFEPVGTSDMVDVFSGDFNYNIPLLDIDGYPINISYNSGVTMDQEASWVGLGWNINPGAVNRNMRGVPDDFSGDKITKRSNMKPNRTYGVSVGAGGEVFGIDAIGLNYSISATYNNYKGVGFEQSLNMQFSAGKPGKGNLTYGLGITSGADGLNLSSCLSLSANMKKMENSDVKGSGSIGLSFNSRSGLKNLSLNASVTESAHKATVANGHIRHDTYTYSMNGGASINFASATYTPQITMPMINTSFALSIKTGFTAFGVDGTANLSGYYSEQHLERQVEQIPAFGYMNSQIGIQYDRAIHDVNREKEGAFTENTPALPITNYSYDVYTVNGQGVGGNYRPFRSELGTVYDPAENTYSVSANLGGELAGGNAIHNGLDVTVTDVRTTSGKWSSDDNTSSRMQFRNSVNGYPLYEPWYFKQAGERAVDSDTSLFNSVGAGDPVHVNLLDGGGTSVSSSTLLSRIYANDDSTVISIPTANYRASRQKRNQAISYLSFAQADDALQPSILKHTHPSMSAYNPSTTEDQVNQLHHIGEISVLRADGARYVYGLPAYNIKQQEVSFNTQGRGFDCQTGIVTYDAGDDGVDNTLGIDNYYSMTETPAYSHSHLLTAIISPDYVDYDTIEGPSKGDLGTYTKFNYVKSVASFKWRTPFGTRSANMNEGLKSDPSDDKGNYVYGEKEVWYLSSVETKNYIAVFTISNREDGLGVVDSTGAIDTASPLKKLDHIDLYSKPDYDANGGSATPIKSVYFEYNYTLCPGTPNRNPSTNGNGESGKLTLKKIYFTYGNSYKAKLSSYNFTYADLDHNGSADVNYSYNVKGYDRWGNYKPNSTTTSCSDTTRLSNAEYPYTDQDQTTADKYTSAWALTSIGLPSGGVINVDYEADDYAYVQDRKAMEMFKVTDVYVYNGSGTTPTGKSGTAGTNPTRVSLMSQGNYTGMSYYVYFKLKSPIANSTSSTTIRNTILNDYLDNKLTNIYFRFYADITNNKDYEYVSGYFDVDDNSSAGVGVAGDDGTDYNYGWIRLKKVPIGDRVSPTTESNPISKAIWQFGRLNLPRKVWNQPDPQGNTVEQTVRALATSSFFSNLIQTFKGPNKTIRDKGYGLNAVTKKSWIRLTNPTGKKFGGGSRVKKITIGDNWKSMTNNSGFTPNDAQYGQQYSYTISENGKTISSGVASYEPQIGGDENPFRQPVYFKEEKKLVPDDESYMEEPFGEMFFPAPGVGYSHVEVKNLQYSSVSRHATGYTVQEFYTARDFPTITRRTDLIVMHKRTNPILSLLKIKMKDYVTASQGYVVELNDMHGKPKAQYVYAENQVSPISEVHYFYKTNPLNAKQLDNSVYSVQKNGAVTKALIGVDYDFVNDMREQQTQVLSGGLNLNLAGFLAGIFPCFVPTILPSWNQEDTRFRSDVVTKVINRYGILERTEAHDAGSTVTTENLAWDNQTGELLLTKTKNDFDDPIYNFTYPAHWAYDHMGQAYKNLLVGFSGQTITSGVLTSVTSPANYFTPGDEVSVTAAAGTHYKAWVCSVVGNNVNLIDKTGAVLGVTGSGYSIVVTRSGRRNQQALAIGGVTMLTNPLKDTNGDNKYDVFSYSTSDKVVNAKAQEYAERWMMFGGHVSPDNATCNCVKSSIYGYVAQFIQTLQDSGKLTSSNVLVYDTSGTGPAYRLSFSSYLNTSPLPSGRKLYWNSSISGQTLTGTVSNPWTGGSVSVTLQLPNPYTYSQISSVSAAYPIAHPGTCSAGNSYEFTFDVAFVTGAHVTATGSTSDWPMGDHCSTSSSITTCGKLKGDVVNPYYEDILGVWRPLRSYLYLADRQQDSTNHNTDIRKDGYIVTKSQSTGADTVFQPFWRVNSGNDWRKNSAYWTWSSEVTKYTPFGNEVENRDALSRYSAAVFGYNHSLPIAVASNAQYQEIAYDGFEDYAFIDSTDCRYLHFNFYDSRSKKSADEAHTGLYSMKLNPGDSISAIRPLTFMQPMLTPSTCTYVLSDNDFVGTFSPLTYNGSKTYVLSYWVKETGLTQPVFNYPDAKVLIKFQDSTSAVSYPPMTLVQKSDVIEGWQQYQYTFVIPGNTAGSISVMLKNTGGGGIYSYFDDIRLHPFDSNMKSYVYNPINLRFTYELDENNYATIYEYDNEGALIRVKKETANGIMTIKESRNNTSH